jgi:hypothetical protein
MDYPRESISATTLTREARSKSRISPIPHDFVMSLDGTPSPVALVHGLLCLGQPLFTFVGQWNIQSLLDRRRGSDFARMAYQRVRVEVMRPSTGLVLVRAGCCVCRICRRDVVHPGPAHIPAQPLHVLFFPSREKARTIWGPGSSFCPANVGFQERLIRNTHIGS